MEVRIRTEGDADSVHFCDCRFNEIEKVIEQITRGGGIYVSSEADTRKDVSYQYVLDDDSNSAYAEIMIHEEDDKPK